MQKFKDENIKASFDFVFLDPNTVPDANIQVTEDDMKNYYDKHKDDFKRDESAKLKYVLFSDAATMEDTVQTEKMMKALTKDLKKLNAADSTTFAVVNDNSASKFANNYLKPNEIPVEVASFLFSAAKDSISDVIRASDGFHMVRLIDTKEGTDTYSNAQHILIAFGTDTGAAKVKAEQIAQRIKGGEDFNKMAAENSSDESNKFKGGDLGWFGKGAMVKEFEDAVTSAKIGEVVGPVKSQFGYHIIRVNGRQNKEFKFADIKKTVKASSRTKDVARKRAEDFAFVSKKGNFDEEAKKLGLQIIEVPNFVTKGAYIPNAGQDLSISKFALEEKKGTISDPKKIQTGYAVYVVTEKFPAGFYSYDELKVQQLPGLVKSEKKFEILKQQAADLKSKISGDINSLKSINPQIAIQKADTVTVAAPSPLIGADFDFANAVYKLQNGQLSEPIRTARGYYIVQMRNIAPFDQAKFQAEYDKLKTGLVTQKKQTIVQDWITDLKDKAVIVDNREKLFRQ